MQDDNIRRDASFSLKHLATTRCKPRWYSAQSAAAAKASVP